MSQPPTYAGRWHQRSALVLAAAATITPLVAAWAGAAPVERPNFIFILTDDQSAGYMGFEGNSLIDTPHLDRLAGESVVFNRAYVTSAICTPSRVSIFLSQYERRHGVNFNSGTSVAPAEWANGYPVQLREAGYYSGYVGKNHVPVGEGGYDNPMFSQSFDYYYAADGHLGFYPKRRHEIFRGATADTQIEIVLEGALDFLAEQHSQPGARAAQPGRPGDRPFVLSIAFNVPHTNSIASMRQLPTDDAIYRDVYRDRGMPLPPDYLAKDDIVTPRLPADLLLTEERQPSYVYVDKPDTAREFYLRKMQTISGVDRMLGALRQRLHELGLADNTVIVFTSDHGLFMGQFGLGGKALCYEEVTRVPFIIHDPRAPAAMRGQRIDHLIQTTDVAPTLLALAGVARPASYQGFDLSPYLTGRVDQPLRDFAFTENLWSTHFGNPRCESVQDTRWKYIRYYHNTNVPFSFQTRIAREMGLTSHPRELYSVLEYEMIVYRYYIESPLFGEQPVYEELFDLESDPRERTNLSRDPAFREQLERMRQVWLTQIAAARGPQRTVTSLPIRQQP
jgi:arylsulfatase A-like enzyme